MNIKFLSKKDISIIVSSFEKSGWQMKTARVLEKYLDEQRQGKRICLVAFIGDEFAGYVTLKWQSDYKNFAKDKIPEISDLNVLPGFRSKGIGCALMEKCEEYVIEKSHVVGVGVGLYPDYGSAQRLYVKCGYLPDGRGATYSYEYVTPGKDYSLDDDLVLWFTKKLH